MATAAEILGDQVGSTAPVFLAFLAVHILAGLVAVVAGAAAAVTRKGSQRHVRSGRLFYRAITVVFATATALTVMRWREDYHLFIVGAAAFAAAAIGYQHRRRRRSGDTGHIVGMGVGYVAMLTAFYVDNGPHLPLWDRLPPLAFWFLPAAIGTPIIARAVLAARKRSSRVGSTPLNRSQAGAPENQPSALRDKPQPLRTSVVVRRAQPGCSPQPRRLVRARRHSRSAAGQHQPPSPPGRP